MADATPTAAAVPADLRARYVDAGQGHVFEYLDAGRVPAADTAAFIAQLESIDTAYVNGVFADTNAAHAAATSGGAGAATLEPMEGITSLASSSKAEVDGWRTKGLSAAAAGEVAALVLAGGQGTRLGFDRPKGEYNLGLPSNKVLFQLQADRIHKVKALAAAQEGLANGAAVSLPYVVMTSPMTDAPTRAYFEAQDYFGLGKENVFFFVQGTLPCFTNEGKIILEGAGKVAEAPDGNGGIYRALHLSGTIAALEKRGVKYVHAFAVDNAVCKVADPVWIGYCIEQKADMGCKVCPKAAPEEKVGVLCKRNGKFAVVEYSDLDDTSMNARDAKTGELTFSAGNICIHFYTMGFLKTKCSPDALPKVYHLAKKKIPHVNPDDGTTVPKSALKDNNGVKLESFIFDVCESSEAMAALSVTRSEEFSPVKNAPGNPVDSPDSARQIFSTLHSGWLTAAGASIEAGEGLVEVSAIVSLSGEGLEAFDGMSLKRPLLVRGASEAAAAAATGAATGAAGADDGAGGAGGGAGAAAGDAVTHSVNGDINVYTVAAF